jgi:6-phosphofructokinase
MIVLRGGQNLKFSDSGRTYVIFNNDVLKVGGDSMVILKTVEDAIVRMGSNAIFQVRPWKQKKKHGFLRMLYGKAIFKVRKFFVKKKRFNFKTATAVAGVRGTEWKTQTTSTGVMDTEGIEETECFADEEIVGITPAGTDFEIHVKPCERSLTLNTVQITRPIKVPVEERVREAKIPSPIQRGKRSAQSQNFVSDTERIITDSERGLMISVVGIPKTIDNDIYLVSLSFGFDTAVDVATQAIRGAHYEAMGYPNGIDLIKLMGRHSGFIAATTTLAQQDVDEGDRGGNLDSVSANDPNSVKIDFEAWYILKRLVTRLQFKQSKETSVNIDAVFHTPGIIDQEIGKLDLDTQAIIKKLTDNVEDATNDSVDDLKGKLKIEFEK